MERIVTCIFAVIVIFLTIAPFVCIILATLGAGRRVCSPSRVVPARVAFSGFERMLFRSGFMECFVGDVFVALIAALVYVVLSMVTTCKLAECGVTNTKGVGVTILVAEVFPKVLLYVPCCVVVGRLGLVSDCAKLVLVCYSFALPFTV